MPHQTAISIKLDNMEVSTVGACEDDAPIFVHYCSFDLAILRTRNSVLSVVDASTLDFMTQTTVKNNHHICYAFAMQNTVAGKKKVI